MDVKAAARAGDSVCLRHGNSGPGAGPIHRRPVPRKRVGSPHRTGGPPAGGRRIGHLKRQPMCRATTSHRVPVTVFSLGACSTRQAMAWIRSPRLYVPKTSAAVSGLCRPTGCRRIRRSTAAASDPAPDPARARPTESTESTRLGASSGRSWAAGRRRSMTSSTRRSAASAKIAAWRMGGDMAAAVTTAVAACGCLLPCRRGAHGVRRRNVAWDDCRHWPALWTFRVGGSYSATGMTAKVSRRGGLAGGLIVNGHAPTHRSGGESAGEWQTSVVALFGWGSSSHNRARRVPAP
jgi:hypothetical protein